MKKDKEDTLLSWAHDNLVTHSLKSRNSNAIGTGVRICRKQALDLPYLCARTQLMDGPIPLDYPANVNSSASNHKLLFKTAREDANAEILDAQLYAGELALGLDYLEIKTASISDRAAQLLLPKDGGYISTTPLISAGHNKTIFGRFYEIELQHYDDAKENGTSYYKKLARSSGLGIGGANPQNVGALMYDINQPILMDNHPKMDERAKQAFSVAHNGYYVKIPLDLSQKYADFLYQRGDKPWNVNSREVEAKHLIGFWSVFENQAASKRRLLEEEFTHSFEDLPCFDRQPELQGWFFKELRTSEWKHNAIIELIERLILVKMGMDNGTPITLGIKKTDKGRIYNTLSSLIK